MSSYAAVKMLGIVYRRNVIKLMRNNYKTFQRFFLSEAFKCTEAWENRIKAPVFKKLQFGTLYSALDKCFSSGQSINVLDVDLFVTGVEDVLYQSELEDILCKLRSNPETSIMYERTSHAAIRWYLTHDKKADLLNILSQRLVYGIFPDIYLSSLMIDKFLKENDCISAVKIAVLQMLQEDCNHPILRTLSLYSCVKYLNSPDVWESLKEAVDEDEEVVKIRVSFLRNEHFDDHFDIVNTNHLVGKAMIAFGKTIEEPIGASSQLIGLVLYEKFDEAKALISYLKNKNVPVYEEAVKKAKSYLRTKPKQTADSEVSSSSNLSPNASAVEKLLDEFSSENILSGNLETELEKFVRKEVDENELNLINKQCEIYKRWEKERVENIETETVEEHKRSVMMEIEALKQELKAEEQKLFFFDHEDDYNEIMETKKIEKENIKYYKPKKGDKASSDEIYIPPQVTQKRH